MCCWCQWLRSDLLGHRLLPHLPSTSLNFSPPAHQRTLSVSIACAKFLDGVRACNHHWSASRTSTSHAVDVACMAQTRGIVRAIVASGCRICSSRISSWEYLSHMQFTSRSSIRCGIHPTSPPLVIGRRSDTLRICLYNVRS